MKHDTTTYIIFSVLMSAASVAHASQEASQGFSLDGRLYSDSAGTTPLEDASVSLTIQILNPAKDCILYEETQIQSTLGRSGYFNIEVGSATGAAKRSSGDSGNTMVQVFANAVSAVSGKLVANPATSCSYTSTSGAQRFARVVVTPSSDGTPRVLAPYMAINSVPSAVVAERAESLQGLAKNDVLQVNATFPSSLTQANLESIFTATGFSRLTSLLGSPATDYLKSGSNGSVTIPAVSGAPASGLAAGQIWYDSSTGTFKFYDGAVKTLGATGPTGATGPAGPTGPTGPAGAAGASTLSSVGAATATNTIANANFAQAWNWDALTTQTGLALGSNSMTTGSVLSVTGSLDSNTSTGSVLKVATAGTTSSAVPLMITNAGAGNSFRVNDDGTDGDTTPFLVSNSGNVGIGTTDPRTALDVNGAIIGKASVSNSGATISFAGGNIQHTTSDCGSYALHHLKDGGTYMFVVKGTTVATCAFTAFSDGGSTALTVHLPPGHGATTTGKHTIYNAAVSGGDVYLAWTPGY